MNWKRLERYARWKQRLFPIERLPPDVFQHVCEFLAYPDVCSLLAACNGSSDFGVRARADVQKLPVEMRRGWIHYTACVTLETHIRALNDIACFHCRDQCMRVHVYADWSMHARGQTPVPLAEYMWDPRHVTPKWRLDVHQHTVRAFVDDMFAAQRCACRLSMYLLYSTSQRVLVFLPQEIHFALVYVAPHFLCSLPELDETQRRIGGTAKGEAVHQE